MQKTKIICINRTKFRPYLIIFFLLFQFQDFRFLCPNDTVFDQQNLVCTNWFEVDCHQSVSFFFQGVGIKTSPKEEPKSQNTGGQNNQNSQRPKSEPEKDYDYNYEYTYFYDDDYNTRDSNQGSQGGQNRFLGSSTPSPNSGNSGVGGGRGQSFQVRTKILCSGYFPRGYCVVRTKIREGTNIGY